ncbi:hypothetical protein [Kitasatospora cineracea]|uniref:Uncharacterized protein n=1 Tax=Kitasatospora cineracea TaxID=88074 RepID=A0A3N4RHW4_9ACTN|nr:hypothetical protein [Kitasatospora cineracea]RPE27947.1 hypothetical protein EDD38_7242 [Kitasatospora cineracea]
MRSNGPAPRRRGLAGVLAAPVVSTTGYATATGNWWPTLVLLGMLTAGALAAALLIVWPAIWSRAPWRRRAAADILDRFLGGPK